MSRSSRLRRPPAPMATLRKPTKMSSTPNSRKSKTTRRKKKLSPPRARRAAGLRGHLGYVARHRLLRTARMRAHRRRRDAEGELSQARDEISPRQESGVRRQRGALQSDQRGL